MVGEITDPKITLYKLIMLGLKWHEISVPFFSECTWRLTDHWYRIVRRRKTQHFWNKVLIKCHFLRRNTIFFYLSQWMNKALKRRTTFFFFYPSVLYLWVKLCMILASLIWSFSFLFILLFKKKFLIFKIYRNAEENIYTSIYTKYTR